MISHDQTWQKRIPQSNRSVKVVYEIKLPSMRSQIKSPIKDQFCFDIMLKSKKDSKSKKKKRKSRISHYEFSLNRYNTIRDCLNLYICQNHGFIDHNKNPINMKEWFMVLLLVWMLLSKSLLWPRPTCILHVRNEPFSYTPL